MNMKIGMEIEILLQKWKENSLKLNLSILLKFFSLESKDSIGMIKFLKFEKELILLGQVLFICFQVDYRF